MWFGLLGFTIFRKPWIDGNTWNPFHGACETQGKVNQFPPQIPIISRKLTKVKSIPQKTCQPTKTGHQHQVPFQNLPERLPKLWRSIKKGQQISPLQPWTASAKVQSWSQWFQQQLRHWCRPPCGTHLRPWSSSPVQWGPGINIGHLRTVAYHLVTSNVIFLAQCN